MPIDVTTTGSGALGDINPGWGVQEFATPANPAETAGGTGMVTFSGKAQDESVLLINNASTVTEPDLGNVSGVIRSVSQNGLTASLTQDTKLARFDAVRQIPPMGAGSVPGALDLADQLTGTVRLAGIGGDSTGALWTLAGHNAGFDDEAERVEYDSRQVSYQYYSPGAGADVTVDSTVYENALYSSNFGVLGGNIYANGLTGDSHVFTRIPAPFETGLWMDDYTKVRLYTKSMLNGQDALFSVQGYPAGGSSDDRFQDIGMTIDYSAATIQVFATYRSGGLITSVNDTVSIAALDLDAEICIGIDFRYRSGAFVSPFLDRYYTLTASVCNTSNYATAVQAQIDWQPDLDSVFFDSWQMTGNFRDAWYRGGYGGAQPSGSRAPVITFAEYVNAPAFSASAPTALGTPVIGFDGNAWQWLQDACTVYRWEIGLETDTITARPMGGRMLDVTNYNPSPTLTPTATFTGRQVDVEYTNATNVNQGVVYEAREDDNRIITVGAAQTTVTTVQTDAYLTTVLSPVRTTTFIPGAGTYYVVDSTGLPIVAGQWEDYGGDVQVSIDPEVVGGVVITVTGPTEEIPSTTAPYSLAVSDGENQYAALSFYGSGVLAGPATLELLTGANPDKTPTKVATTVSNVFIATREQAFDTGLWASVDASGPKIALTLSVPTRALVGFGVTPGSLIAWRNSTYRIVDASVGNLVTSLNCIRHVTVADFDAVWAGSTVAAHDAAWDGYLTEDQKVLPYRV